MFSRVFISYHRNDFGGHANLIVDRIREHLADHYGTNGVFLDTESIPAGSNFEDEVSASLSISSVLIAVVGPNWCDELDKRQGQVDHVLVELRTALSLGVPIVPLCAEGICMPTQNILPKDTIAFSKLNALTIRSGDGFRHCMGSLIERVEELAEATEYRAFGFKACVTEDSRFGVERFHIGNPEKLTFREFFTLMKTDDDFKSFMSGLLSDSKLASFIFEMPPIRLSNLDSSAEFVLLPVPVMTGEPDRGVYAEYFAWSSALLHGVVSFPNLGKDALLVVPAPLEENSDYKDLRSFLNNAPLKQQQAFWNEVGTQVLKNMSDRPMWVSVAGGGIPWLHFRLDKGPKYYRYAPYRNA